jgi:hypothetical protein
LTSCVWQGCPICLLGSVWPRKAYGPARPAPERKANKSLTFDKLSAVASFQSQKLPRCCGTRGATLRDTERAGELNRHGRAGTRVEKVSLERPRAFARRGNSTGWGLEGREGSEGGSGLLRVGGGRHLVGSRSPRAERHGRIGGGPRSAERMPGTTHSRRSSDDDEGVGAAFGQGRSGRSRKVEPARARSKA